MELLLADTPDKIPGTVTNFRFEKGIGSYVVNVPGQDLEILVRRQDIYKFYARKKVTETYVRKDLLNEALLVNA